MFIVKRRVDESVDVGTTEVRVLDFDRDEQWCCLLVGDRSWELRPEESVQVDGEDIKITLLGIGYTKDRRRSWGQVVILAIEAPRSIPIRIRRAS